MNAEHATDFLRDLAAGPPQGPWPGCAPASEFLRSPAAMRVGQLAARDGLTLFHFEHRVHLPLPLDWVPEHDPELAEPPQWVGGVLPEAKYQSFQHDSPLGSFHPGHRAKWSTHELCHALVGFAWRPDASPWFHALAGRLAELLPVALYYGFDEAFLTRCERHAGEGALFRTYCPACEAAAAADPCLDGRPHVDFGLRYLDAELAAIARSRRLGRSIPHRFATLDLASDGVAYARAHGARLASEAMERWIARFARPVGWGFETLDELEARVVEVAGALLGGSCRSWLAPPDDAGSDIDPASPVDAAVGARRWQALDLAWRMGLVWHECEGEAADELDALLERFGAAVAADEHDALATAATEYAALDEEFELLPPAELLGQGFGEPLDDEGTVLQLAEGLRSACPGSASVAGTGLGDGIRGLLAADRAAPRRLALPWRWAERRSGPERDLASFEAALATAPVRPTTPLPFADGGPYALCEGVRALRFSADPVALADAAEAGRPLPQGEPVGLVFGRDDAGELVIAQVPAEAVAELNAGADTPEGPHLAALGLAEPACRAEQLPDSP